MVPIGEYLAEAIQLLQNLLSDAAPIISAVLAIVIGRYIWTWRSKPVLKFDGTSTSSGYDYDPDEWDNAPLHFRVHLKNLGLSSAENCKPEIHLSGKTDERKYEISTPACWSEGEYPARRTINRGERISFDLFRQGTKDGDNFLRFPSERGWPEYSTLGEQPTPKARQEAQGAVTSAERNKTPTTDLESVEWEVAKVVVTSENADAVEAEVSFNWDSGGSDREDVLVNVNQTHGSGLLYWRLISSYVKDRLPHISFYGLFPD